MPTMNVSLTPELLQLVQSKVASGMYNNASEFIREAIRKVDGNEQLLYELKLARLIEALLSGIVDAENGVYADGRPRPGGRLMAEFRRTRQARASLMQIGLYTQQRWGRQQRIDYLKIIDGCFQRLADDPKQGKARPYIHGQLRSYPAGKQVVFYLIKEKGLVVIVNVLHERIDPFRHLPMESSP